MTDIADTPGCDDGNFDADILIVDDMAIMQKMIGKTLELAGYTNLRYASDGKEAYDLIDAKTPDIVILDIQMPVMTGLELCALLRSEERFKGLPVLVQSASESASERAEVFKVGATDFVSKPINQREMLARISLHLENRRLIRDLTSYQARLQTELEIAHQMQLDLMPDDWVINKVTNEHLLGIAATCEASTELGGDLWFLGPVDNNHIAIAVIDVAGHGVASALSTFRIHATMRRFEDLMSEPAKFMGKLNAELAENFSLGQFATMFFGLLNTETGDLTYCGAAAPPPIIVRADGTTRSLNTEGHPIGISQRASYEVRKDQLACDETLICYSDVLVETPLTDGEILGFDGFERFVGDTSRECTREDLKDELLRRFGFLTGDRAFDDDLTLVGLWRREARTGDDG